MTVYCAWCNKLLGHYPPEQEKTKAFSICSSCRLEENKKAYKNGMYQRSSRYYDRERYNDWPRHNAINDTSSINESDDDYSLCTQGLVNDSDRTDKDSDSWGDLLEEYQEDDDD